VTRGIGLISLLVVLGITGALFATQNRTSGPALQTATEEAAAAATGVIFQQVTPTLQAAYAQNGTYAGAELPAGSGVTVVRADATGYCLEATVAGAVVHEDGPAGSPVTGPC
jgi:hypothetical protein